MEGCSIGSGRSKQEKNTNKRINKQLQMDNEAYMLTQRILVLGHRGSGKSAFMKQLQIIHGPGISTTEKLTRINTINSIMHNGILALYRIMSALVPPVSLEHPIENEARLKRIEEMRLPFDPSCQAEFYDLVEILWRDKGIQAAVKPSADPEYAYIKFPESSIYFLDRVFIIKRQDYLPNEQDILRCSKQKFFELQFQVDGTNFQMSSFEAVTSRYSTLVHRAWIQCLFEVRTVIYVVDCSVYDRKSILDSNETELHSFIQNCKQFWDSLFSKHETLILLLLNKHDILEEKLRSGKSRLDSYFPEFSHFQTPPDATPIRPGEDAESTRAKYFILYQFYDAFSEFPWEDRKYFFPYFTSALDAENIRCVFGNFRDILAKVQTRDKHL